MQVGGTIGCYICLVFAMFHYSRYCRRLTYGIMVNPAILEKHLAVIFSTIAAIIHLLSVCISFNYIRKVSSQRFRVHCGLKVIHFLLCITSGGLALSGLPISSIAAQCTLICGALINSVQFLLPFYGFTKAYLTPQCLVSTSIFIPYIITAYIITAPLQVQIVLDVAHSFLSFTCLIIVYIYNQYIARKRERQKAPAFGVIGLCFFFAIRYFHYASVNNEYMKKGQLVIQIVRDVKLFFTFSANFYMHRA